MREAYITAKAHGGDNSILSRIGELFVRVPDTDFGPGVHFLVDLTGTDGFLAIQIVCENHDIPVCDFRRQGTAPIREIVKSILEKTPPRCAIVLDTRDNELVQKVRSRIAGKDCDLRYRRVIFCLADQEQSPAPFVLMVVPGSVTDRLAMLLYHIPKHIRDQAESLDCFRPLAESMVDYALFEPRVWRDVNVSGGLDEFLSSTLYQIIRRVRNDPGIDDGAYPSFEMNWRRSLATRLRGTLRTAPDALCPSIHRVIPIGVSPMDAMQAMEVAIPKDLQDPYAVTVQSSAMDDRCGSIAITQPTRCMVVHINCMISPGILVDVCRELRSGHRDVVSNVHAMNKQLSQMKEETKKQLSHMKDRHDETLALMKEKHEETNLHLSTLQTGMIALVTRLADKDKQTEEDIRCSKTGCRNVTQFRSGRRQKQCVKCQLHVGKTNAKRKSCGVPVSRTDV